MPVVWKSQNVFHQTLYLVKSYTKDLSLWLNTKIFSEMWQEIFTVLFFLQVDENKWTRKYLNTVLYISLSFRYVLFCNSFLLIYLYHKISVRNLNCKISLAGNADIHIQERTRNLWCFRIDDYDIYTSNSVPI